MAEDTTSDAQRLGSRRRNGSVSIIQGDVKVEASHTEAPRLTPPQRDSNCTVQGEPASTSSGEAVSWHEKREEEDRGGSRGRGKRRKVVTTEMTERTGECTSLDVKEYKDQGGKAKMVKPERLMARREMDTRWRRRKDAVSEKGDTEQDERSKERRRAEQGRRDGTRAGGDHMERAIGGGGGQETLFCVLRPTGRG